MKIALIISGRVTCARECLLPILFPGVDVHIVINGEYSREIYETYLQHHSSIKSLEVISYTVPEEYKFYPKAPETNAQTCVSMFYTQWLACQNAQRYEKQGGFEYDLWIKFRPDIIGNSIFTFYDPSIPGIHIPRLHRYNGMNDQIAIGRREEMIYYLGLYPRLFLYLKDD